MPLVLRVQSRSNITKACLIMTQSCSWFHLIRLRRQKTTLSSEMETRRTSLDTFQRLIRPQGYAVVFGITCIRLKTYLLHDLNGHNMGLRSNSDPAMTRSANVSETGQGLIVDPCYDHSNVCFESNAGDAEDHSTSLRPYQPLKRIQRHPLLSISLRLLQRPPGICLRRRVSTAHKEVSGG